MDITELPQKQTQTLLYLRKATAQPFILRHPDVVEGAKGINHMGQ
jgi:hypothetical protein